MVVRISFPIFLLLLIITGSQAQVGHTTNDYKLAPDSSEQTVDSILAEAQILFMEKRPLDARAKLQQALQMAPEDFRPNFYLGVYYLTEVGHFQMADRYLTRAEHLFKQSYGSELDGTLRAEGWKQNAKLLQYLTEAKLNLDNYKEALKYADRFGDTYWDEWFPGTRAWILMKLRRIDEAIQEAQSGILRGADETRTYNILGILYSLKGDRKAALESFKKAIKAELKQVGSNQAATPLNNSGEVYHELFQDDLAEASWLRALQLPDGCDHILPSLNTALLYIEQLRLFQAERVLADFEACFSQKSPRSDTEHRALIALARGKIALHEGDFKKALRLFLQASDREQFYGKIGTDPEDIEFASSVSLSKAYLAEAERLRDQPRALLSLESIGRSAYIEWLKLKAWWQLRAARQTAISKLNNFEDIYIRNTDSMIEYPTLGIFFNGVPTSEINNRLDAIRKMDARREAWTFYDLYLLQHEVYNGATKRTIEKLETLLQKIRSEDPLLKAQTLSLIIKAYDQQRGLFTGLTPALETKVKYYKEELFNLLPSQLRMSGSSLPVSFAILPGSDPKIVRRVKDELTRVRFEESELNSRNQIQIEISNGKTRLSLVDTKSDQLLASVIRQNSEIDELISEFLDKVFGYRVDASSTQLPKLEIMDE